MLCLGGLGLCFGCVLRCPAQLGGSLVTFCLPRLRPAGVSFALLLQALPFCCGLHPVATAYVLWRSLFVVPGCLSNGRLSQQWVCTSVGADCLSNGRRPSPMQLHFKKGFSTGAFRISVLFVALRYPKHCVPEISWAGSLSKSHSVSSSALSGLSLPVQQGTHNSALLYRALWSSAWRPVSLLYLGISPFCGQLRFVWKCVLDSPSPCIQRELQSWVVLTAPS